MGLRDCALEQSHPLARTRMEYRYLAATADGLVSQVVRYAATGHTFFFTGRTPAGPAAQQLDRKLIRLYGVDLKPWTRSRRRSDGASSVHYVRFGSRFVLLASAGYGPFFEHLGEQRARDGTVLKPRQFKDLRRVSLEYDIYAIRCTIPRRERASRGRHRVLVRLNRTTLAQLKRHFLFSATRHPRGRLEEMFWRLGVYPYRPVLEQLLTLVRAVNRHRRNLGLREIDSSRCVRRRKPPLKVFAE